MTLLERLKKHDWYWGYSDDHRYWTRGRKEAAAIRNHMERLSCPYSIDELRKTVLEMVFEDFAEEEPGNWYRQPRKYKNIAPTKREELLYRADQLQIYAWLEHHDSL